MAPSTGALHPARRRARSRRRLAARGALERRSGSGRSGSTCTCRSARCAAATATSTPTRPTELGDGPAPRRRRTPTPAIARGRPAPRRVLGDRDAAGRRRCSSAAARRPCCRPADLARCCAAIGDRFGLADGAEVTTEANPDSVDAADLARAARGRLHPGLASACSRRCRTCCATLDRTHDPRAGRRPSCVGARGRASSRSAST